MLSTHIPDLSKAIDEKEKNTGRELEQRYIVGNTYAENFVILVLTCP